MGKLRKRILLTVGAVFAIVLVCLLVVPPPVEGYWRSKSFDCMCGHKNLLSFHDGETMFFSTVHEEQALDLGSYKWDKDQNYVISAKRKAIIFTPGWIRFKAVVTDTGEVQTGYRELRPWFIRDVLSHFGAELGEAQNNVMLFQLSEFSVVNVTPTSALSKLASALHDQSAGELSFDYSIDHSLSQHTKEEENIEYDRISISLAEPNVLAVFKAILGESRWICEYNTDGPLVIYARPP